MESYTWYAALIKPTWAPPAWLFGPVWTMLYVVIAISFTFVFYKAYTREIPLMVALPFALNLLFNLLFTPVQFGLKNNELATLVILLVLGTLVWALIAIFPYARMVTYANVPYLAWVCFATVLQLSITVLNR
jgi:tryptophan-rich sensory protein